MTVTVTRTFATDAEAAAWLSGKSEAPQKDPKPAKSAAAASPAPTPPTAELPPPPAAAPAPTPPAGDAPVTYEASGLGPLIQKAVSKDRAAIIALLAKYGAKKGPEVKPDKYAEFKLEVEALLAAAELS